MDTGKLYGKLIIILVMIISSLYSKIDKNSPTYLIVNSLFHGYEKKCLSKTSEKIKFIKNNFLKSEIDCFYNIWIDIKRDSNWGNVNIKLVLIGIEDEFNGFKLLNSEKFTLRYKLIMAYIKSKKDINYENKILKPTYIFLDEHTKVLAKEFSISEEQELSYLKCIQFEILLSDKEFDEFWNHYF